MLRLTITVIGRRYCCLRLRRELHSRFDDDAGVAFAHPSHGAGAEWPHWHQPLRHHRRAGPKPSTPASWGLGREPPALLGSPYSPAAFPSTMLFSLRQLFYTLVSCCTSILGRSVPSRTSSHFEFSNGRCTRFTRILRHTWWHLQIDVSSRHCLFRSFNEEPFNIFLSHVPTGVTFSALLRSVYRKPPGAEASWSATVSSVSDVGTARVASRPSVVSESPALPPLHPTVPSHSGDRFPAFLFSQTPPGPTSYRLLLATACKSRLTPDTRPNKRGEPDSVHRETRGLRRNAKVLDSSSTLKQRASRRSLTVLAHPRRSAANRSRNALTFPCMLTVIPRRLAVLRRNTTCFLASFGCFTETVYMFAVC